jgi:hypothetical protein
MNSLHEAVVDSDCSLGDDGVVQSAQSRRVLYVEGHETTATIHSGPRFMIQQEIAGHAHTAWRE